MEDMDIDFDVDNDPIKRFLLHKLKEVELNNEELQQQVVRRKELLKNCVEKMVSKLKTNFLEISNIWQRTNNDKWVIGINVQNKSIDGSITNINVVLKWDLPIPLIYRFYSCCQYKLSKSKVSDLPEKLKVISLKMEKTLVKNTNPLEDEWIQINEVKENASLILTFDVPELLDKTEFEILGILTYEFDGRQCQLNIPKFNIKVTDILHDLYKVKSFDVISGNEEAYLSTLVTNERTDLVAHLPQVTFTKLDKFLEFDCKFRKINLISRTKTFFYVNSVAKSVNRSFLELEAENDTVYNLFVYTQHKDNLQLLLHYIYQNVPNILILPKKYKEKFLELQCEEGEFIDNMKDIKLQEFGKSLEAQADLVEKFCIKKFNEISEDILICNEEVVLNVCIKEYQNFRKDLSKAELKSDILYVTCSKFINSDVDNEQVAE